MSFPRLLWIVSLLCVTTFGAASTARAGAISVPPDAREMIEAAQAILEEERLREEAEGYIEEADGYVESTEAEAKRAEAELAESRDRAKELEEQMNERARIREETASASTEASARAAEAEAESKRAMDEATAAVRRADALNRAAQKKDAELARRAAEAERATTPPDADLSAPEATSPDTARPRYRDDLRDMEAEMREAETYRQEQEEARKSPPPDDSTKSPQAGPVAPTPRSAAPEGADWATVRSAYGKGAALERRAGDANRRSEEALREADKRLVSADEAIWRADEAKLLWEDAEATRASYEKYAADARAGAEEAVANRDALAKSLENPPGGWYYGVDARYHTWRDGTRGGYQTAIPISVGYWGQDFSAGLLTHYVFTDYLNTLTDTQIYLNKRVRGEKYTFDYSLGINVPTGKSALDFDEMHARRTEDLVTLEQFGKGWQFTPGVAVTWKTSKEESWTIGTYYTFSQSYDPTSHIPNDDVSPGGEWQKFVRYRNVRPEWQWVVELWNSTYGSTKNDDGSSYRENPSWDFKTAYNKKLNDRQDLMFYYWLERKSPVDIPLLTDSPWVHYVGTMWKHKIDDKQTLRLAFDVMHTNGSRYMGMYSYYDDLGSPRYASEEVDGRTKYTFGVGYDYKINETGTLRFDIEFFQMHDGISTRGYPATVYDGWNIYLSYFATF